MNGIIFFATKMLDEITSFYIDIVGAEIWLKQADCKVLKFGNMIFGFCKRDTPEIDGILCFVLHDRDEVNEYFSKLSAIADNEPKYNEKYNIYHFFARDPEGRKIEFQSFEHQVEF
jgi:hypothetical protein